MTDDTRCCRRCAAPLEKKPGPGRWPHYCSDVCRDADRPDILQSSAPPDLHSFICVQCSSPFLRKGRRGPDPLYCSAYCRGRRKWDLEKAKNQKPCLTCGVLVSHGKTCSVVCYRRLIGIPDERCHWCGKEFQPQWRTDRSCSAECKAQFRSEFMRTKIQPIRTEQHRIKPKQCTGCGITFTPKTTEYSTYCTRECAWASRGAVRATGRSCTVRWAQCSECQAWFVGRGKRTECGVECKRSADKKRACQRTRDWHLARGEPVANLNPVCDHCGAGFSYNGMGRTPKYCGERCREKNPAARLSTQTYRRMRRLRVALATERVDPLVVYERDGGRCQLCHSMVDRALPPSHRMGPTIDHIVPVTKGGAHLYTNVQLAHRSCNSRRGNRGIGQPRLI